MKQSGNILFSGVGGQGILLASELTAYAQLGPSALWRAGLFALD